jgi:hypothetical protein
MSDPPVREPPREERRMLDLDESHPAEPVPKGIQAAPPAAAPSPATLRLRRNEKLKASADILNKAAGAFLGVAVITPFAGGVINPGATKMTWSVYLALALVGVSAAMVLHMLASKLLDKLEA